MNLSSVPYKFQYVWGQNAASGFVTDPVPATTSAPAASQSLGFPPATAEPTAAGGTPPNINDVNGALFYVTSWTQWLQAGFPVQYDATFQTNIGGYPNTALIGSVAYPGVVWQSTADNNTSDPDTGGANWQQYPSHGQQSSRVSFSFTVPAGVTRVFGEGWGAGGGGGGTNGSVGAFGGGGGGGGYTSGWLNVVPGQVLAVTVGVGGISGSAGSIPGPGGVGGTSSVTDGITTLTATGGSGGQPQAGAGSADGGNGGTGTGGTFNFTGGSGAQGYSLGGGGFFCALGGPAWQSGFGAPQVTGIAVAGPDGIFPGQGGGGSYGGAGGGVGSAGLFKFTW